MEEPEVDNRLKPESKRNMILCAHQVLARDGFDEFSVRKVASECGCGVSSLYRHFSSRDELMLYASIWKIPSYLSEVSDTMQAGQNSLYHYFRIEQSFAKYSFAEPVLFYNMYFGPASHELDRIFLDSLELFQDSYSFLTKELKGILSVSGGISARNLTMLERCRQDGFITLSSADLIRLNDGIVRMYRGFLDEAVLCQRRGEDTHELEQRYLDAHRFMHQRFLAADVEWPF